MKQLLEQVQQTLSIQQQAEHTRLLAFKQKSADKKALLIQLKQDLESAQSQHQQLSEQFSTSKDAKLSLAEQLQTQSTELTALFTIAKNQGQGFLKQKAISMSKVRYQEELSRLDFSSQDRVPNLQDLQSLWFLLLQNMVANSGIQQYQAPVITESGAIVSQRVTQIGPFAALDATGQYLKLNASKSQLQVFNDLPSSLKAQGVSYIQGQSTELSIDPEKGKYFELASRTPTLQARLQQGGIVGYVLIGLGILGLAVSLWRTLYLSWVSLKVSAQLKLSQASHNNPLGRVLLALKGQVQQEKAEMLVEKVLLQEAAKLERFNSVVKLLAAVAPLLGLLGTVTGMIETFQSITLQGTNDPKLMAGGISQALITTVMGLCVAIPLLFAHSYISAKSRQMLELIQQQCLLALSQSLQFTQVQQLAKSSAVESTIEGTAQRQASQLKEMAVV